MTSVAVIAPANRDRAISTLTLAFATDPVVRWIYNDPQVHLTLFPGIVEAFAGNAFEHGTAFGLEEFAAIALWLPPGVGFDEEGMGALIEQGASDAARPDLDGFFGQMGESHPSFECWYLPLTGVDPVAQGRGLGSALMAHALARCDRDGVPAYLEATSPRNRDLYARHGFRETGLIQQGGSPPLWPMLRQPN